MTAEERRVLLRVPITFHTGYGKSHAGTVVLEEDDAGHSHRQQVVIARLKRQYYEQDGEE